MDPKITQLIITLIEKSKNKTAIWNSTNSENQFKLLLPNNSYLTIGQFSDSFNTDGYYLSIYNEKGSVIVSEESNKENGEYLEELFKQARTVYHKVDETIDGFLEALKSPGIVGEEEPPKPEEDELPF